MLKSLNDLSLRLYIGAVERLIALRDDNQGADFAEYAVITGTVLLLVGGTVVAFGNRLAQLWTRMTSLLR